MAVFGARLHGLRSVATLRIWESCGYGNRVCMRCCGGASRRQRSSSWVKRGGVCCMPYAMQGRVGAGQYRNECASSLNHCQLPHTHTRAACRAEGAQGPLPCASNVPRGPFDTESSTALGLCGLADWRRRRRSALAHAGMAASLSCTAASATTKSTGVFSLGTARAGVPFDGGIGGEMTRSNAAADPRRWPIHFCTHKQVVRVVAWTIPACIKPVWGARNAIEAARASRLLQDAAGQHAGIALEAGAL